MTYIGLSVAQIYALTAPRPGPSGALAPNAYTNFKNMHLQITSGYAIDGLEPGNLGTVVVFPSTWKNRGG